VLGAATAAALGNDRARGALSHRGTAGHRGGGHGLLRGCVRPLQARRRRAHAHAQPPPPKLSLTPRCATSARAARSISLLTRLLGRIYYQDFQEGAKPGKLPIDANAAVSALALVGTLLGQLAFGYLGDKLGRKRVYGISLLMMIVSSVASGMTFGPGSDARAAIGTLCFFRFWLGFGVGGDYPLSATIMSEYSNTKNRGAFVAAVFAMQGIGILTAAAVALIVTSIFRSAVHVTPYGASVEAIRGSCPPQADYVWRIVLAFGALPAMATMYARMLMPETPRFTLMVQGNVAQATRDTSSVMNGATIELLAKPPAPPVRTREFLRRWWKPLLGCSMSWFLLDIAFYSQNVRAARLARCSAHAARPRALTLPPPSFAASLPPRQLFQKDVFTAIGWIPHAEQMDALEETYRIARAQALIALGSTVPGYFFTVAFIDRLGRKPIQLGGFALMTALMAALSGWYLPLRDNHQAGFVTMYALTFFFSNFGPNATTFVLPAELFPTAWKSTAHGICAASGKAGAIIGARARVGRVRRACCDAACVPDAALPRTRPGAFGFLYASQPRSAAEASPYAPGIGLRETLGLLAAINFAGMWFTLLIPETKGKSLEELNGEDVLPQVSYASAAAAEVALVPAMQQKEAEADMMPAEQGAPPPLGARRA
jgi:PHS family inorganic phosphate transporter-like MFS transporter